MGGRRAGVLRRLALAALLLSLMSTQAKAETLEEPVCGLFGLERSTFRSWSAAASSWPPARSNPDFAYEDITLETPDGRKLAGYRVSKSPDQGNSALLFLQGNAIEVDQLRDILARFAAEGFDTFAFDYRGYGRSDGEPYLKAIARDQKQILEMIVARGYDKLFVYGMSFGGIVALGPDAVQVPVTARIIDGSPARLPWIAFCPSAYDPLKNLPEDASNMLVISGGRDMVIRPRETRPMGDKVKARGGEFLHVPDYGHPLADGLANTRDRYTRVIAFLKRF